MSKGNLLETFYMQKFYGNVEYCFEHGEYITTIAKSNSGSISSYPKS